MTRLLAGGWKQRLALGCAILHDPPVLFLDEPTSGVDPIARRGFWDLIYQLSAAGRTIFVSTHYMDEAEYCHRLALMYRGRVVALGAPVELKSTLAAHEILYVEPVDLPGAMTALQNRSGIFDTAVFGAGLHISVESAQAAIPKVREALGEAGIPVRRVEAIDPSMEDVFVAVIEKEERAA
jgi:ABC-2 type transport system ATP-binding protein